MDGRAHPLLDHILATKQKFPSFILFLMHYLKVETCFQEVLHNKTDIMTILQTWRLQENFPAPKINKYPKLFACFTARHHA